MTKARQMLFMVFCLFLAGGLFAQNPCENQPEVGQEYTAITTGIPAYAYTSIVSPANLAFTADDGTFMYTLEHPVSFYGAALTDLLISSNGFFSTDLTTGSDLGNTCPLPSTDADGLFAVLHDDLDMANFSPGTEGVYTQYSMPALYPHAADADMGAHVIQWIGDHWPGGDGSGVDFQALIYDNGDILYIYNLDIESGAGSTSGWQESSAGPDVGNFNCNTAGVITPGTTFAISAHGATDFADDVAACQLLPPGVEEVSLAAISEINVTLNENCRSMLIYSQILAGDFDVDDNGLFPNEAAISIVVEDNDPSNGPIIDGCGQFIWTATGNPEFIAGFTTAWGYVNAEDKTSPVIVTLPVSPDELFCNDVNNININLLANNISRCWTQSGQDASTLNGSMSVLLRNRLLDGGGIPNFFDGCSNVEICVNDLVSNNDACDSTVITRVFTATDGDCPSVSGETNAATVVSYDIVFNRPSIDSVVGVDSLSLFSCDDNPPLLPPNGFGNANPAPTVQDFPFLELNDGTPIFLSADGFCNIGATFQDGPRIVTCANTYKFVRTFTVIDWCDVNNIRTFTQLVKVGDFEAPTLVGPTQDLNFDGVPDVGPLFYSTNTPNCEAIFAIPAGSATDNCDATPVVSAVIYPGGDTTALGFGPYAVGQLTLAGNGGIPAGDHIIRYSAVDDCGNITMLDVDLTIGDQTAPVAICEDGLNISIGGPIGASGGIAQLCAVDVNAASYDDCSDINLAIRVTEVNGVALTFPNPLFVFQACHTLTCDQLGDVEIELRVTDDADGDGIFEPNTDDNTNFCWLDILVEDKTAPICISPAPVTVTCADLANDFPQDLNLEFATDPIGTAALLDAQFGTATGLDNCPDPVVTQTVFDNRNSCGVGTIQRTFTVTDAEGFMSPPSCAQLINVIGIHDYTVVFPGDQEDDDCVEPDYNGVTYTENGCDLITVSSSIDTFTATADECYKLRVNYEVLNWCEYNTINPAYAIPRDADGDNILDMDITVLHVLPNGAGLNDDVAILDRDENRSNFNTIGALDSGDGGPVNGSSVAGYGQDLSRGAFTYIQFIKVYDDTPPTLVVNDADPICSFDGVNCDADVELGFSITDECSPESVSSIVELDAFINAGADGIFTLAEFVSDGNVTDAVTNNGDGTFTINLPNIPIGRHALRIRATDGCGNTAIELLIFEVVDCKAPTPICINGLTVTLMPDGNGGGMADIWVSDFIASPSTDCSGPVKFAIYTNDFVLDQGDNFVPNALDTGLVLTCDSDATTMIRIYAIDAMGQSDYCLTTLLVQENTPGICTPGDGFGELAGVIMTEAAGIVPGVNVAISGDMTASTTTNAQGVYNFSDLSLGEDFTVSPEFDSYEYHLAGVSTFDLVLISKHILGIEELSSAYSLLAADANADENVSVQDIIAVRRLILGLDLAYANSPAWMFVDAAFSFPVPVNPWATSFPEVYSINNINGNVLNADFVAVMVGNVDGNGMANLSGSTEGRGGDNIVTEDIFLLAGVPTSVKVAYNGGFQGTLGLAAGVEVVSVIAADVNSTAFNMEQVASGLVAFSDMNGQGFELVLRSSTDVKLSEVLSVNNRLTTTEGYPANAAVVNLGLNFTTQAVAGFELLQNAPNPVADITTVGFNLPVAADFSITVQDITGKVVLRRASEGVAGYNTVVINRNELGATGVLTYTLVAGDFTATKKMVVVK